MEDKDRMMRVEITIKGGSDVGLQHVLLLEQTWAAACRKSCTECHAEVKQFVGFAEKRSDLGIEVRVEAR